MFLIFTLGHKFPWKYITLKEIIHKDGCLLPVMNILAIIGRYNSQNDRLNASVHIFISIDRETPRGKT